MFRFAGLVWLLTMIIIIKIKNMVKKIIIIRIRIVVVVVKDWLNHSDVELW